VLAVEIVVELRDGLLHRERRAHGALRVVLVRQRSAEYRLTASPMYCRWSLGSGGSGRASDEIGREDAAQVLGVELFGGGVEPERSAKRMVATFRCSLSAAALTSVTWATAVDRTADRRD